MCPGTFEFFSSDIWFLGVYGVFISVYIMSTDDCLKLQDVELVVYTVVVVVALVLGVVFHRPTDSE